MKYFHALMVLILVTALEISAANELVEMEAFENGTTITIKNNSARSTDAVNSMRDKFKAKFGARKWKASAMPAGSHVGGEHQKQIIHFSEESRTLNQTIDHHECVCECDCSKVCPKPVATTASLTKLKATTTERYEIQSATTSTIIPYTPKSEGIKDNLENNQQDSNSESCAKIMSSTRDAKNGVYTINLFRIGQTQVYCYKDPMDTGCGWTLFMRRKKTGDLFDKNWQDYQKGFGELKSSFFLGLDKIHALTNSATPQELGIFTNFETNHMEPEKYAEFRIGDENTNYIVEVLGNFSKTSLIRRVQPNSVFSTKDKDNGVQHSKCANFFNMGWWYTDKCRGAIKLSGVRAYLNAPVVMGLRPKNCMD